MAKLPSSSGYFNKAMQAELKKGEAKAKKSTGKKTKKSNKK